MKSASDTLGSSAYLYDGDGKRAAKAPVSQPTQPNKIYWYGMGSDPLDETDGLGNTNNSSFNEYVFFGGQRIARRDSSNNVFYYFSDHLGTSREIVQAGQTTPCYDADFYPFGGEAVLAANTCSQNYKFTGKERDSESGLDNFGARYNSSSMGRFMSPDAFYKDSHVGDPQSWNEYAYARNNPLRYVDPTGEEATVTTTCTSTNNQTTCNVNVSASIAIYAVPGSGLTQDQLDKAASTIKSNIETAWAGSFPGQDQNGNPVTYNVSTQISVSVAGSQDAAMQSGAQNAIGLSNGPAGHGEDSYVDNRSPLGGPDTGVWNYNHLSESAHEFGHLLGVDDRDSGFSIFNHLNTAPFATPADLKTALGGVVEHFTGLYDTAAGDNGGMVQRGGRPIMAPGSPPQTVQWGYVSWHNVFHHWWK